MMPRRRLAHTAFDLNFERDDKTGCGIRSEILHRGSDPILPAAVAGHRYRGKTGTNGNLGLSDGQAHLAMCQIATETSLPCRFVAVRRASENEPAQQDPAWVEALRASADSYSAVSELLDGDSKILSQRFDDRSIDVLFIDDVDAGEVIQSKLASLCTNV